MDAKEKGILNLINYPNDLKKVSIKDLKILSSEIRSILLDVAKTKSIHLSSNLGIVELSIALLYVFDLPKDKLVYDTGHQAYVHKILTGRKNQIYDLKSDGGLNGFQDPNESIYDQISTGHSGNSLSFLQALAASQKPASNYHVCIIGDAALSNGQNFEALNQVIEKKDPVIIVINDNGMSISKSVGALSRLMSKIKLTHFFFRTEKSIKKITSGKKKNSKLFNAIYHFYNWIEQKFLGKNFFQSLGYQYVGPINGHNLKSLILGLKKAQWYLSNGPVIVHVKTKKGKGYEPAELDWIGSYHGLDVNENFENYFGYQASEYLLSQNNIKVIIPAMTHNSGFDKFVSQKPNDFYDVGISEEHAVSFAAGFSSQGYKTFVVIYSTFLQRSYDQILHDISRTNYPINLLIDRADLSPSDGPTHHGIFDLSFLRTIPNTIITSPRNYDQLKQLLSYSLENKQFIFCIRYPKKPFILRSFNKDYQIQWNSWEWMIKEPYSTCIISYGPYCDVIYEAIKKHRLKINLVCATFITEDMTNHFDSLIKNHKKIIFYERVINKNNLYDTFCNYYKNHRNGKNINVISKNYQTWPGFGSLKKLDQEFGMDVEDLLKIC